MARLAVVEVDVLILSESTAKLWMAEEAVSEDSMLESNAELVAMVT